MAGDLEVIQNKANAAVEQAQDKQYIGLRKDVLGTSIGHSHLASQSSNYMIYLHAGTMSLRFMDLQKVLPASHQQVLAEGDVCLSLHLKTADNLAAANQAVEGLPCSLLPEGR